LGVDDLSVFFGEFALLADDVADVVLNFLYFGFFQFYRNVVLVGELEVFDLDKLSGVVDNLLEDECDLLVGVGDGGELGYDGLF
jgi:hypothetical protein